MNIYNYLSNVGLEVEMLASNIHDFLAETIYGSVSMPCKCTYQNSHCSLYWNLPRKTKS